MPNGFVLSFSWVDDNHRPEYDVGRFAVFFVSLGCEGWNKRGKGIADRADSFGIPLRPFVRVALWRGLKICGEGMGEDRGEWGDGRAENSVMTGAFSTTTL